MFLLTLHCWNEVKALNTSPSLIITKVWIKPSVILVVTKHNYCCRINAGVWTASDRNPLNSLKQVGLSVCCRVYVGKGVVKRCGKIESDIYTVYPTFQWHTDFIWRHIKVWNGLFLEVKSISPWSCLKILPDVNLTNLTRTQRRLDMKIFTWWDRKSIHCKIIFPAYQ